MPDSCQLFATALNFQWYVSVNSSRFMERVFAPSRFILHSEVVILAASLPTLNDVELVNYTIEIHRWKPRFVRWRDVPGSALVKVNFV
jgi:hypothetical protein